LQFLDKTDQLGEKVGIHCSSKIRRAGQVLTTWLVHRRGFSSQEAISTVKRMGQNPYEAAIASFSKGRSPWAVIAELNTLLDDCHVIQNRLRSNKPAPFACEGYRHGF
jgi:hypothetical protein